MVDSHANHSFQYTVIFFQKEQVIKIRWQGACQSLVFASCFSKRPVVDKAKALTTNYVNGPIPAYHETSSKEIRYCFCFLKLKRDQRPYHWLYHVCQHRRAKQVLQFRVFSYFWAFPHPRDINREELLNLFNRPFPSSPRSVSISRRVCVRSLCWAYQFPFIVIYVPVISKTTHPPPQSRKQRGI